LAARPVRRLRQGAQASQLADCTIWQAFEADGPQLYQSAARSTGSTRRKASVSKTCLVRFDNTSTRSPRAPWAAGRDPGYADRVVIRQDGAIVGEHQRPLSAAARRATIPGITCRCSTRSPAALRQRSPLQGLAAAGQPERVAAHAEGLRRRRAPDGQDPLRGLLTEASPQ